MKTIEIIVPCLNEEECIEPFCQEMQRVFESFCELYGYNYLITFVDDGSSDDTLAEIKRVMAEEIYRNKIRYISFSRNFGKEAAIYAGLRKSVGTYVAIMDVDLQHPPKLLADMLHAINEEGYDCATARRISRSEKSKLRKKGSSLFFRLFCKITGLKLLPGSTDYRLMNRAVVDAILSMPEYGRFTKGIYSWIGFNNKWIEYEDIERIAGNTKWSTRGLIKYAYHGFLAFATTPLRAVVYFGMLVVVLAVVAAIWVYVVASINGTSANGFATIMIAMLLMDGVIISILGVIGEYMARIYLEVKNRPIYIVREQSEAAIDVSEM